MKHRLAVLAAALLLVATAAAGCGDEPRVTPVSEGTRSPSSSAVAGGTTTAPAADETSFDADLPRAVRYGDFRFEVTSLKRTNQTPKGVTPNTTVAAYAVLTVSASTALQEYTWTIPTTDLFHLKVGGETIEPVSQTSLEINGTKPATADVAFPVGARADLSKAALIVQEHADDPDDRRIPAKLPMSGKQADKPWKPVTLTGSPTEYKMGTIGDSVFLKVVSAELSPSVGTRENGGAWPATSAGLRQPREGHQFLRVHFEGRSVNDSPVGCGTPVGPGVYRENGVASDNGRAIGSDSEGTLWCEGEPPYDVYGVWEVPLDRNSFDIFVTGEHNSNPGGGDYTFRR